MLETVDLIGVEILSTGGPVFGIGSPPEGDFWTADDLRAMAEADAELGDEVKPPNKIGHPDGQTLIRNSIEAGELDLPMPKDGEMPAVGWLENLRVNDDGTKLLADIMSVPKKLASLIEAGAWRTRSVELSRVESQTIPGKVYDWVVTGLAWLGGKMPAVRTLDDVVALYEGAHVKRVLRYEAGALVWTPLDGLEGVRAAVSEALNGGPAGGMIEPRFWVRDVDVDKALVEDWDAYGSSKAWIVPFARNEDGTVTIGATSEWVTAEPAWVESAAKAFESLPQLASGSRGRRADTRREMGYTDEQRRKFAEATGLELDKVTDELLADAGVIDPAAAPEPPTDEETERSLEQALATAKDADERARKLEEQLRVERRTAFVEGVLRDGKAEPGQREQIEKMYDADAETARAYFSALKPNEDLAREYGSDEPTGEGTEEERRDLEERQYSDGAAARLGIPAEELI